MKSNIFLLSFCALACLSFGQANQNNFPAAGAVTGVTAGTGLTGGGSSGGVTLNVAIPISAAIQGFDVGAASTSSAEPSLTAIKLELLCSNGFNYSTGTCNSGGTFSTFQQVLALAITMTQVNGYTTDIDGRAFFGTTVLSNSGIGATPLTLFGCTALTPSPCGTQVTDGVTVPYRLWLGNLNIGCDGPSAGYYTDGLGSQVGTPCLIRPSGMQLFTTPSTVFFPCKGANNPSGSGCTTAFPQRTCGVSSITGSGTSYTVNITSASCTGMGSNTSLVSTGGFGNNQNIWPPPSGAEGGELAQLVTGTALSSITREVITVPSSTSFTIKAESANAPTCASGCGSVYFYTPIFGYAAGTGSAGNNCNWGVSGAASPCPYTPVQALPGQQSFNQQWIGGALINTESYYGAVGVQEVNAGEGTLTDNVWCADVVTNCWDLREATDFGPINNTRVQPSPITNVVASTLGMYVGWPMKGIDGPDIILAYSGAANQPWASIQADGSLNGVANYTVRNWHCEYAYSCIEGIPNYTGAGIRIENGLSQPSGGHAGTYNIRVLSDGTLCKSCLFLNNTSQSSGVTDNFIDDGQSLTSSDLSLAKYETDINGVCDYISAVNLTGTCAGLQLNGTSMLYNGVRVPNVVHYAPIPSSDTLSAAGSFATQPSISSTGLKVGSKITVRASGIYTTTSTANPLMEMNVTAGGTSGICTAANRTLTVSITTGYWDVLCYIQIQTTGASGTAQAWGGTNSAAQNGTIAGTTAIGFYTNSGTLPTYNTSASAEPVVIKEVSTLVSGQTFQLLSIDVEVVY